MKQFPITIRIISILLIISFIAYDISWAYPDHLAASSFFKEKESPYRAYGKIIEYLIEQKHKFPIKSFSIDTVKNILKKYSNEDWFKKNLAYTASKNEVLITIAPEYILRYFDPNIEREDKYSNQKEAARESTTIAINENLHKQLIKVKALPSPAIPRTTTRTNFSFGEGVGLRHMQVNSLISFHNMTIVREGPYYVREHYELELPFEEDSSYNEKIMKAIGHLKIESLAFFVKGVFYFLLSWLPLIGHNLYERYKRNYTEYSHYYDNAIGLEKDTTFILVDMPTPLLLSGIGRDGKPFYQLTHIGRRRRIIFIPKKFLDNLNIASSKDMRQLATALNHDQTELDLMHKPENIEQTRTISEYEELVERLHKIAKADDPFSETKDLELRIADWSADNPSIIELLKSRIEKKKEELEGQEAALKFMVPGAKFVYKYDAACTAMQIGYAYEVMDDKEKSREYYDIARNHFYEIAESDVFILPILAQINIIRLDIFNGDYAEAGYQFGRILDYEIGTAVHYPRKYKRGSTKVLEEFLYEHIDEWVHEVDALMRHHAEETGDLERLKEAFLVLDSISSSAKDFLEEQEAPRRDYAKRELKRIAEELRRAIKNNKRAKARDLLDSLISMVKAMGGEKVISADIKEIMKEARRFTSRRYVKGSLAYLIRKMALLFRYCINMRLSQRPPSKPTPTKPTSETPSRSAFLDATLGEEYIRLVQELKEEQRKLRDVLDEIKKVIDKFSSLKLILVALGTALIIGMGAPETEDVGADINWLEIGIRVAKVTAMMIAAIGAIVFGVVIVRISVRYLQNIYDRWQYEEIKDVEEEFRKTIAPVIKNLGDYGQGAWLDEPEKFIEALRLYIPELNSIRKTVKDRILPRLKPGSLSYSAAYHLDWLTTVGITYLKTKVLATAEEYISIEKENEDLRKTLYQDYVKAIEENRFNHEDAIKDILSHLHFFETVIENTGGEVEVNISHWKGENAALYETIENERNRLDYYKGDREKGISIWRRIIDKFFDMRLDFMQDVYSRRMQIATNNLLTALGYLRGPEDGGCIGNYENITISSIESKYDGSRDEVKIAGRVQRIGSQQEERLTLKGWRASADEVDDFIQACRLIKDEKGNEIKKISQPLQTALFHLLQQYPGNIIVLKDNPYGINGIGSVYKVQNDEVPLIAIHRSIFSNPIAKFHELAHLANSMGLIASDDVLSLIKNEKIFARFYVVKLAKYGYTGNAPEPVKFHCALRALQREHLGVQDEEFSDSISGIPTSVPIRRNVAAVPTKIASIPEGLKDIVEGIFYSLEDVEGLSYGAKQLIKLIIYYNAKNFYDKYRTMYSEHKIQKDEFEKKLMDYIVPAIRVIEYIYRDAEPHSVKIRIPVDRHSSDDITRLEDNYNYFLDLGKTIAKEEVGFDEGYLEFKTYPSCARIQAMIIEYYKKVRPDDMKVAILGLHKTGEKTPMTAVNGRFKKLMMDKVSKTTYSSIMNLEISHLIEEGKIEEIVDYLIRNLFLIKARPGPEEGERTRQERKGRAKELLKVAGGEPAKKALDGDMRNGQKSFGIWSLGIRWLPRLEELKAGKKLKKITTISAKQINRLIWLLENIGKVDEQTITIAKETHLDSIFGEHTPQSEKLKAVFSYMIDLAQHNEKFRKLLLEALRSPPIRRDVDSLFSSNLSINSIVFATSRKLPINSARYFDDRARQAVIVFNESFFNMDNFLMPEETELKDAVYHIMAERLLHELRHDNHISNDIKDERLEEEWIIANQDVPLWQITQEIGMQEKIDLLRKNFDINRVMHHSGRFFVWMPEWIGYLQRGAHLLRSEVEKFVNRYMVAAQFGKAFPGSEVEHLLEVRDDLRYPGSDRIWFNVTKFEEICWQVANDIDYSNLVPELKGQDFALVARVVGSMRYCSDDSGFVPLDLISDMDILLAHTKRVNLPDYAGRYSQDFINRFFDLLMKRLEDQYGIIETTDESMLPMRKIRLPGIDFEIGIEPTSSPIQNIQEVISGTQWRMPLRTKSTDTSIDERWIKHYLSSEYYYGQNYTRYKINRDAFLNAKEDDMPILKKRIEIEDEPALSSEVKSLSAEDRFFQQCLRLAIPVKGDPIGMITWPWKPIIKLLHNKGWPARVIASLGGLEELFFSGLLISGFVEIFNMFEISPIVGLFIGFMVSITSFPLLHLKDVLRFKGGVFDNGPPDEADLAIITSLGIILRSAYITLLFFMPFEYALATIISIHSFYNSIIAPWLETAVGMVDARGVKFISETIPMLAEMIRERRKTEEIQRKWRSAIVVFGSARVPEGHSYYNLGFRLGEILLDYSLAVRSGAGPGMMKAVFDGYDHRRKAKGIERTDDNKTQGVRIDLAFEQETNEKTERVVLNRYFITRKITLHNNTYGAVATPGGIGTWDEVFETWRRGLPLVLLGKDYWQPKIDWLYRSWREAGLINQIKARPSAPFITDNPREAVKYILKHSKRKPFKSKQKSLKEVVSEMRSLTRIKMMPRSVTFVGKPAKDSHTLLIAERLANQIAKAFRDKPISVRVASRGTLLERIQKSSEANDWASRLQAVLLLTPHNGALTQDEHRLARENLVLVRDESNHQFLTANNSHAFVFLPGGVGTLNKLFDILQVIQAWKGPRKPVILVGKKFWQPLVENILKPMLKAGGNLSLISEDDLDLFKVVDSVEEAWDELRGFNPKRISSTKGLFPDGREMNLAQVARDLYTRAEEFSRNRISVVKIGTLTLNVPNQLRKARQFAAWLEKEFGYYKLQFPLEAFLSEERRADKPSGVFIQLNLRSLLSDTGAIPYDILGGLPADKLAERQAETIIERLDASPNQLWSLIKDIQKARQEFKHRCEHLLKNNITRLIKDELHRLSRKRKIKVQSGDIEKIDIVLFGDWLRRPKNVRSEDLDILVLFKGSGRFDGVLETVSDRIPSLALHVRNLDNFKKSRSNIRDLTMLLFGNGIVVSDGRLISEIEFEPLLAKDILAWAERLLDNGDKEEGLGDLSDPQRQWERYLEALLYIQHLLSKPGKDKLEGFLREYLGEYASFKEFFVQYYLGKIESLPWSMPASTDLIWSFRELVSWLITDISRHIITLETDKGLPIEIWRDRFPDGELYLRILNPDVVKDARIKVTYPMNLCDDVVEIVLLLDMLRRYGAENINLILNKPYMVTNGLDTLLRYYCDDISYRDGKAIKKLKTIPLEPVKEKKRSVWIDRVLYRHPRLKNEAEAAARSIHAESGRIEIAKATNNPLDWNVDLTEDVKGENVVLVHNTQDNEDIVELWLMLMALRRAGVASISLINTYEGYARQDKVFKRGEGISAVTMLKALDALVDNYFALNVHYGKQSGAIQLEDYKLYNLNTFVQVGEKLIDTVEEMVGRDKLAEELAAHPILMVSPDDGAFGYVKEARALLPRYIKDKYGIDTTVHCGYMDKERISATEVRIKEDILGEDGKPVSGLGDIKEYRAFVLDDETSEGSTLLATTYVLVRKLRIPWQRILTGVVHGKLVRGFKPFETGWRKEEITKAIEPKPAYINESKGLMPPRLIVCTESISLRRDFPEKQKVSIFPIISYAVKRIIGVASDKEGNLPREDWPKIFGNNNPIYLEIGPGDSDWIVETARENPNRNYVAIEIDTRKGRQIAEANLKNLKLVYGDAKEIVDKIFTSGQIEGIYINFPDSSLLSLSSPRDIYFIKKLFDILRENGRIESVSENQPYIQEILRAFFVNAKGPKKVVSEEKIPIYMPKSSGGLNAVGYLEITKLPRSVGEDAQNGIPGSVEIIGGRNPNVDETTLASSYARVRGSDITEEEISERAHKIANGLKVLTPQAIERISHGDILLYGPGAHIHEVLMLFKVLPNMNSLTIIDPDYKNLEIIKKALNARNDINKSKIEIYHRDFSDVDQPPRKIPRTFDAAYSRAVFCKSLLSDDKIPNEWFDELKRVLKPNGVYITLWSEEAFFSDHGFIIRKFGDKEFIASLTASTFVEPRGVGTAYYDNAAFSEDARRRNERYRKLLLKDASVDKDYFELLFQANMDLLVLSRKRMLAKEREDSKAYEDALGKINLLVQNIKAAIDEFEGTGEEGRSIATTKDYREEAKEHLNTSIRLIEAGNEQAANRAIWAALADIAKDREELSNLSRNVDRKFFRAFKKGNKYVLSSGLYEKVEGSRTTMRVGAEVEFGLLWQAFASCDDQIEGELLDRFIAKDVIGRIDKALEMLDKDRDDEAKGMCSAILEELGTKKKVEEKRLGIIALDTARRLIELGDRRTAKDVLNIARRFFAVRFDNTRTIIEAIQAGRVRDLRRLALARNQRIIDQYVNPILKSANERDFKCVRNLLSRATSDFMKEPEFRTLMPLVWKCIYDIRERKDPALIRSGINSTMQKLAWRVKASETLGDFMKDFMDTLAYEALEKELDYRLIKDGIFKFTFQGFLKKPGLIRGPPRGSLDFFWTDLFWTILYQAAFIPLEIDNPLKKTERISNPLFEAIDTLILTKIVDDISILLNSQKFTREHPNTANILRKLIQPQDVKVPRKVKKKFINLKLEEKALILDAIARDYNLSQTEIEMFNSAAFRPDDLNIAAEGILSGHEIINPLLEQLIKTGRYKDLTRWREELVRHMQALGCPADVIEEFKNYKIFVYAVEGVNFSGTKQSTHISLGTKNRTIHITDSECRRLLVLNGLPRFQAVASRFAHEVFEAIELRRLFPGIAIEDIREKIRMVLEEGGERREKLIEDALKIHRKALELEIKMLKVFKKQNKIKDINLAIQGLIDEREKALKEIIVNATLAADLTDFNISVGGDESGRLFPDRMAPEVDFAIIADHEVSEKDELAEIAWMDAHGIKQVVIYRDDGSVSRQMPIAVFLKDRSGIEPRYVIIDNKQQIRWYEAPKTDIGSENRGPWTEQPNHGVGALGPIQPDKPLPPKEVERIAQWGGKKASSTKLLPGAVVDSLVKDIQYAVKHANHLLKSLTKQPERREELLAQFRPELEAQYRIIKEKIAILRAENEARRETRRYKLPIKQHKDSTKIIRLLEEILQIPGDQRLYSPTHHVGHTETLSVYIPKINNAISERKYHVAFNTIMDALKAVSREDEIDKSAVNFEPFMANLRDFVTAVYANRAGPGYKQFNTLLLSQDIDELESNAASILPALDYQRNNIRKFISYLPANSPNIYNPQKREINMAVFERIIDDVAKRFSNTYDLPVKARIFGSLRYLAPDTTKMDKDIDILLDFDEKKLPWDTIRYVFIEEVENMLKECGSEISLRHKEYNNYLYPHIFVKPTHQYLLLDIMPAFLFARGRKVSGFDWRVEDNVIATLQTMLGDYKGNVNEQKRALQFYVAAEYYFGNDKSWQRARSQFLSLPLNDYNATRAFIEDTSRQEREEELRRLLFDQNEKQKIRFAIRDRLAQPAFSSTPKIPKFNEGLSPSNAPEIFPGSPDINTPHLVERILERNPNISFEDLLNAITKELGLSSINDLKKQYPNVENEIRVYLSANYPQLVSGVVPNGPSSEMAIEVSSSYSIYGRYAKRYDTFKQEVEYKVNTRVLGDLFNDEAMDILYEMAGNIYRHSKDRSGAVQVQAIAHGEKKGMRFVATNEASDFGLGAFFVSFDDVRNAWNDVGTWHVGFEKMIHFADEFTLIYKKGVLTVNVTKWQQPLAKKKISIQMPDPNKNEIGYAVDKIRSVPNYNYERLDLLCLDEGKIGKIMRNIKKMVFEKQDHPGSPDINTPHIVERVLERDPGISFEDLLTAIAKEVGLSSIDDLKMRYRKIEDEVREYLSVNYPQLVSGGTPKGPSPETAETETAGITIQRFLEIAPNINKDFLVEFLRGDESFKSAYAIGWTPDKLYEYLKEVLRNGYFPPDVSISIESKPKFIGLLATTNLGRRGSLLKINLGNQRFDIDSAMRSLPYTSNHESAHFILNSSGYSTNDFANKETKNKKAERAWDEYLEKIANLFTEVADTHPDKVKIWRSLLGLGINPELIGIRKICEMDVRTVLHEIMTEAIAAFLFGEKVVKGYVIFEKTRWENLDKYSHPYINLVYRAVVTEIYAKLPGFTRAEKEDLKRIAEGYRRKALEIIKDEEKHEHILDLLREFYNIFYEGDILQLSQTKESLPLEIERSLELRQLSELHNIFQSGLVTQPITSDTKVLLSEDLFIKDGDRTELDEAMIALKSLLDGGYISISTPEEIRRRAMNAKVTKDKMAIVLTKGDFDNKEIWNGSDKETAIKASMLILDDKLTGVNYLYLEGVIGLARAIMANDKQAIKAYYRMLSGLAIDDDILKLLDDKRQNNIAFALKAILKFKPITGISDKEFESYRLKMESFLISA